MVQQSNAPTTADSEEAEIVVFGQGCPSSEHLALMAA
jgi:hypothetical protein